MQTGCSSKLNTILFFPRVFSVDVQITNGQQTCDCLPGYNGDSCQTQVDNCVLGPCLNGGTCHNLVNNYICECEEYYEVSFTSSPHAHVQ